MYYPYHVLLHCEQGPKRQFLVVAAGPRIFTFNLNGGSHVDTWSSSDEINGKKNHDVNCKDADAESVTSPNKRPRLSPELSRGSSTEIVVHQDDAQVSDGPSVVRLATSLDGKHVIAVTAEDKRLRVFELLPTGELKPFSVRYVITFFCGAHC